MLFELIVLLSSGSLLASLVLLLCKIISDRCALIRFKKLSRGLPISPGASLLGNHISALPFRKQNCRTLKKWHGEMGKTIGWLKGSEYCASTIDLNLIKTFILDEPDTHMNRMQMNLPLEEFEKSIMLAPKEEWRHLRKTLAPAFTGNKFKTPNVLQEIEASIGKLIGSIERRLNSEKPDHLFEVDDLVQKYSLDLVFKSFYKQDNIVDFDDPNDLWVRLMDASFVQLQASPFGRLSVAIPFLCTIIDWLVWHFTPQGFGRRKVLEFVKSQTRLGIEARKQLGEMKRQAKATGSRIDVDNFVLKDGTQFKRNMVDHIIDQFLDGKLTKSQYLNNSCFLMAAANRTASDCIGHTIYLLSINPKIQQKLRHSIQMDGNESEYLEWVLFESLRLRPPAPVGCSRSIERDMQVDGGHIVPAGTFVVTCSYVIHRLKEYWGEDADEFKPERWRDTSHHHPFQYLPFGAGPRGCPGRMFAMHEMKMLFAALLKQYRFEGEPSHEIDNFDSPWWIYVIPTSPIKVKIHRL